MLTPDPNLVFVRLPPEQDPTGNGQVTYKLYHINVETGEPDDDPAVYLIEHAGGFFRLGVWNAANEAQSPHPFFEITSEGNPGWGQGDRITVITP